LTSLQAPQKHVILPLELSTISVKLDWQIDADGPQASRYRTNFDIWVAGFEASNNRVVPDLHAHRTRNTAGGGAIKLNSDGKLATIDMNKLPNNISGIVIVGSLFRACRLGLDCSGIINASIEIRGKGERIARYDIPNGTIGTRLPFGTLLRTGDGRLHFRAGDCLAHFGTSAR
jgi:stress response protein SCP2